MHLHNEWLLGKAELIVNLPKDFVISPKEIYLFCGSLQLSDVINVDNTSSFDSHSLLFAISYLILV